MAAALAASAACAAPLALDLPGLQAPDTLTVSLADLADGGVLPANYAADGRNLSPPLSWTAGPAATAGYVVVAEDADGAAAPVHWVAYDIPKGMTALPRGVHNLAAPTHPLGLLQGPNDHGSFGYTGAQPLPDGVPPHHYAFEVFALDRPLRLRPGASLARVERAMAGHVLARGRLVLTYPAPPHPPRGQGGAAPAAPAPASPAGAPDAPS